MLKHPGSVTHHTLVISQLLEASRTVIVASNQRVVALAIADTVDCLCVLPIITSPIINGLDRIRELAALEQLVTFSLITVERG